MSEKSVNSFFIIALLLLVLLTDMTAAQPHEEINNLIENILSKNLKSIIVNTSDSVLVNRFIKKAEGSFENRRDSTQYYLNQAIIQAEKAGLIHLISHTLQLKGKTYLKNENFEQASFCFISALEIEEKLENKTRIAEMNDELGMIYFYQEIFVKSLDYHEKALKIYKKLNDKLGQAKVLSHLGSLYSSRDYCEKRIPVESINDQKIALDYYQQSLAIYEELDFQAGVGRSWLNIGNVYRRMNQPEKALDYLGKALEYFNRTEDETSKAQTLRTLALTYNQLAEYNLALDCLKEAEEISVRDNLTDGIQFLYETISQTFDNLKDYKNARDYYVKYMILRDSIYNIEKSKQIFELETKYQTEKKQSEIEKLTMVKKQRTLVIYILIASLFLILLLSYMYFRNIRIKNIIADQQLQIKEKKLAELEKERQLTAAKSVLLGEEAERTRLAGDLHDGLGGLLTGVKLNLSSMKENSIITNTNLEHFNRALDLLDTSINEMRRVAHNLMPETLVHYGLQTALHDFVKQITPDGEPKITFNTFGNNLRFSQELEITIYRISQELITNAIKHANASQIDIQLFTQKERICVQVIDNGIGFDVERNDISSSGRGLKNINDRISAFNGRFEILSQTGKGTECMIEFFIT